MAISLLKHVFAKVDYLAEPYELKYVRTKEGREIDFALIRKGEVESVVEAKVRDKDISPHLLWVQGKHEFKAIQLVRHLKKEYQTDGIEVRSAENYLSELML